MPYLNSNAPDKISEIEIKNYLLNNKINLDNYILSVFDSIDSTNDYLKQQENINKIQIACAEEQINGRGRFGRTWESPHGHNIYLSIKYPIITEFKHFASFSLCVSLCLVELLEELDISDINIKWPNDILYQGKKLSGILIEANQTYTQNELIIGIGINVNVAYEDLRKCSLFDITKKKYNRNYLIAQIITNINAYFTKFTQVGLQHFINKWSRYDYLFNKEVIIQSHNTKTPVSGIAKGINEYGELLIMDAGVIKAVNSGEATLQRY